MSDKSDRQSVNSDFERETKLVVLNFLGLVPASCPATADVRVDDEEEEAVPQQQRSRSAEPATELVTGSCSNHNGTASDQQYNEVVESSEAISTSVAVATCVEDGNDELADEEILHLDSHMQTTSTNTSSTLQPSSNAVHHLGSELLQVPARASPRSPSPQAADAALLERRLSSRSTNSSRSRSSTGMRNSSINVQLVDLEPLVRNHSLPPLVIPLRDRISHEIQVLEQPEGHNADAAQAVSPETEVADVLRTIGDRVNEEFGELISQAVAAVWQPVPNDQGVTYAALKAAAENLIARVHPGWSQVAVILLLSQQVAFNMLSQGHSSIGNLADNTTRFIEDHVADFIVRNGGWFACKLLAVLAICLRVIRHRKQSILDKQLSELLSDSGTEDIDHRDQASPQELHQNDAGPHDDSADAEREFIPACNSVPSSSHDDSQTRDATDLAAAGHPDIFTYVALCIGVVVMASAFFKQILKK